MASNGELNSPQAKPWLQLTGPSHSNPGTGGHSSIPSVSEVEPESVVVASVSDVVSGSVVLESVVASVVPSVVPSVSVVGSEVVASVVSVVPSVVSESEVPSVLASEALPSVASVVASVVSPDPSLVCASVVASVVASDVPSLVLASVVPFMPGQPPRTTVASNKVDKVQCRCIRPCSTPGNRCLHKYPMGNTSPVAGGSPAQRPVPALRVRTRPGVAGVLPASSTAGSNDPNGGHRGSPVHRFNRFDHRVVGGIDRGFGHGRARSGHGRTRSVLVEEVVIGSVVSTSLVAACRPMFLPTSRCPTPSTPWCLGHAHWR